MYYYNTKTKESAWEMPVEEEDIQILGEEVEILEQGRNSIAQFKTQLTF